MSGWIRIHRQIFENAYYFMEPFTRSSAWIDMILLAAHKPATFMVRGNRVQLQRGQLAYAMQTLAERWQWSRGKVRKFLNELEKDGQIVQQKSSVITCVSIVNYEKYQQESQQKANRKPTESQQKATYKNIKNIENEKKDIYIGEPSKKIQDRIEEFRQEVKSYSATYPLDLLEEFFIYWAEPDKTNRRFRKELQKTWDTNLRIHTWARRSKTYNNNGRSNKRSGVTGADIDAMVDAIFGEDAD